MRTVLDDLSTWWRDGRPVAAAAVVSTWRAAPQPAGVTMLVRPDGTAVGTVSGGCAEAAVHDLDQEVVGTGRRSVARNGVSDDMFVDLGADATGYVAP